MSFIKNTLKNTASLVLTAGIITTAYAALSAVNPGDTLTSSSWNEVVSKLSNTDTNSSDLVTKSYVDSVVSAAGGVSWAGYTSSTYNLTSYNLKTINSACNTQYAGSHWASIDEIRTLGSLYPWTDITWVSGLNDMNHNSAQSSNNYYYGPTGYVTNGNRAYYDHYLSLNTDGGLTLTPRTTSYKIPCVY